ncbi:16S rRNA (uracil(1498)-N(3))-methyltransferase [Lederbergia wuyishanensis]|uniref:Ribosomal RNA small subunit methyltransferase E n=1 Tax=Lederbergia wuyishanensis TaxID=1347903 RepID=A0ABU0D1J4_9BACI|nr:16S rRNA (uracil(1498)-N(3))-methyltransferase [Lederbergia wuyishanensis]MCJ8006882.1 16S rRNA (uracil(1498)-N(3))-methyltransferase [Lederbergia wuyishanensis]MDQ0342266.1 16S rRNA (uracil1498-N3)-methyltransferase [Lederbergia wuyishanensis]
MQRYFIDEAFNNQKSVRISGEDFHHITRVMRMKEDDMFWVVFKDGKAASVKISQISDSYIEADMIEFEKADKELPIYIAIASGLPKGDKFEWIIQKGTELGASEFIPFIATRSVVKWESRKESKKLERWNKIAKEAAEQSHRQFLPFVHSPYTINELIQYSDKFDWKILAYEEAAKEDEQSNFVRIIQSAKPKDKILIVFGPEGGITVPEKNELTSHGFEICGLGPRILRTETAPLYALAAISYQFELMR